ncbi:hypothetical protein SERLADRAFT_464965 [Serpula lacrymans var. lacrymans S7.9]|uniref:Uncharacterized protein n=1 Tax=Serpula lacrymans var. lacrymans (strain S7.9) TaxID=578457 RepID=F8NUB0_SERL9|nr:uncharacterized protein SERLADRAFT_464965 [Serpula lacrymans var. lacrymans S7.9]EGO25184.1 hypothetical protein SERLADRAFT_464965 [Serpula lacrymans var. lacrymans S7.9]
MTGDIFAVADRIAIVSGPSSCVGLYVAKDFVKATPNVSVLAGCHCPDGFGRNVGSTICYQCCFNPVLSRAANNSNGRREGSDTSISAPYSTPYVLCHEDSRRERAESRNRAHRPQCVRERPIAPSNIPSKVNDPDKADGFIARSKGLIPAERHGNEEDAVAAVTYFSSRAGSYVSGNTLRLNGGLLVDG